MKFGTARVLLTGGMAVLLLLSGCKSEESYKRERIEKATEHFQKARKLDLPENKVLSLQDCIDLAMKNNLEVKVQKLEEEAAKSVVWAEILGMLPDLTVTENFTGRSNTPGTSSKAIASDGETYGYSTSQDKNINNLSVDFVFSLLDFGLAFFNSQQSHDRALLKARQIERMRQNLKLDVIRAYFKLAAAQRAVDISTALLEKCKNHTANVENMRKKNIITPFRAFEEIKRFQDMERRLTNYTRVYENSCVELRALLGAYPSVNVIVDDTVLEKLPKYDLPDIEILEQMAILKRPELYEIDIQQHINVLECRKTLVMMMPNVQLYMDFINNNNSFLYYQSWWELAVRAAYNALKTPQYLVRYMAYSKQADIEELRAAALAITVMSQVRIAKADIVSTNERYELNRKALRNYNDHLKKAESIKNVQGSISALELDYLRLTVAEVEIERLLSLSSCHIAYYRLLNSIGVNNLNPETQKELRLELQQGTERAKKELEKAQKEYEAKQLAAVNARIARILFDEGIKYQKQNNALAASEYFRRSAEKGDASAMYCLGNLYYTGSGVEKDPKKAEEYYIKASEAGNPEAMMTIAWIYYTKANSLKKPFTVEFFPPSRKYYKLAAKYYKMAATRYENLKIEADHERKREMYTVRECKACFWLGESLYCMQEFDDAMFFYKRTARIRQNEHIARNAMTRIGCMYRRGFGKEGVDYIKAMEWFQRAAFRGDPIAMINIAMMYEAGEGVPKNLKLAEEWYKKAENNLKIK